eukprot:scaffold536_cov250-Pinguiococcus_pyrenoidosus.AAC.1
MFQVGKGEQEEGQGKKRKAERKKRRKEERKKGRKEERKKDKQKEPPACPLLLPAPCHSTWMLRA